MLADPSASAFDCRDAAVTLAGFGSAAREHATATLLRMLDDPWTPDDDLAKAATGLIERVSSRPVRSSLCRPGPCHSWPLP